MTSGRKQLRAQPGRQRQFSQCEADIAIYGGAAGGGKSFALLLEAAKWVHIPGYRAVLFRRVHTDLMQEGGLWDESQAIYAALGGTSRESPRAQWTFPSGAKISFDHLQHEKTAQRKQGLQAAFIGFDELTHFTESQFWYLIGRLRTTCGVKPYLRGTCNPDPDSFVRKLIDWWIGPDGLPIAERAGVIRWISRVNGEDHWADDPLELRERFPGTEPKSFTFIPAKLEDNPALLAADPAYASNLDAQTRVERARLKDGNWDIRAQAGDYFKRSWFELVEPSDPLLHSVTRWVRGWDLAATEPSERNTDPDWTVGAKVGKLPDGCYVIAHVERLRAGPGGVETAIKRMANQDGPNCTQAFWQDPGQAGKSQVPALRRLVSSVGGTSEFARATKDKVGFARTWSPKVERGEFFIVRGAWTDEFFNEAEGFPTSKHDDQIDAVSRAHEALQGVRVSSFRIKGL